MPVPSSINDLSTTAGSNYPQGSDTPSTGDDTLRALGSFIAQMRDSLNGTASTGTLKSPSLVGGMTLTNSAQAGATVFDWYEEGTFTPAFSFGGAAQGGTYSVQSGNFTRFGNLVSFELQVRRKGTGSGAVSITGLPYAPVAAGGPTLPAIQYGVLASAIANASGFSVQPTASGLDVYYSTSPAASGGVTALDASYMDNASPSGTGFSLAGVYRV